MNPNEARVALNTGLAILALVALRLVAAAFTPITFDEAYYWMWSKHLAGGYYDHPPMVAVVIRLGTLIAGDTEFGVRLVSILLALPMSWAVYRATAILFGSMRLAATATILLNVTLMAAVGTMIVTPDAPVLVASCFVLFALAKVLETGRGAWWLAVGASVGAALLSKYTALFFGPAIVIWVVSVPKLRGWLLSPWLYFGGLVALAIFAPVIFWNADHQWVSFIKQIGRARIEDFHPASIAELVRPRVAFATRLVSILGAWGFYAWLPRMPGASAAPCVLAPDSGTAGWLAFYRPRGTCVVPPTQRTRWVNMPEPDPAQLTGKVLYVDEARALGPPLYLQNSYTRIERVAELPRKRGPLVIETYALDLLEDAKGEVIDHTLPPELQ